MGLTSLDFVVPNSDDLVWASWQKLTDYFRGEMTFAPEMTKEMSEVHFSCLLCYIRTLIIFVKLSRIRQIRSLQDCILTTTMLQN